MRGQTAHDALAEGIAASPRVTLRLAIGREGIGIELAHPVQLGCLSVTELVATLPGTRFPIDVSGGVPRFRHRRGVLERLALELDVRAAERWAAPRLRGIVGARMPEVWLCARAAGATVCVFGASELEDADLARRPPIVAFEVRALAVGNDLAFIVERARGSELPAGATCVAIACAEALFGSTAVRAGATFVVRGAADAVARSLLPQAGARVPESDRVRWTSLAADSNGWTLRAARSGVLAEPSEDALRAREVAVLLRETDDALLAGDESRARSVCIELLGRAPGHVEIVRRLVEIDARAGGRAEAVLATM
ncbi:MAG: hypothetical protein M3O50_03965, partial [Myxococcota bacterium]|nr:hypothetical protein [Myxococcota bacterium]